VLKGVPGMFLMYLGITKLRDSCLSVERCARNIFYVSVQYKLKDVSGMFLMYLRITKLGETCLSIERCVRNLFNVSVHYKN